MPKKRPTHAKTPITTPKLETASDSHASTLLTRRNFIYGAVGVGAALAVAGGVGVALNMGGSDEEENLPETLSVASSAVTASTAFTEVASADHFNLIGNFELPYGTLVWTNNDTLAACLIPTEDTSKPLTKVGILYFSNGSYPIVLESAVGSDDGFDIYDVRANGSGIVWTEVDIAQNLWRIYATTMKEGVLGKAVMVDEGDSEWETPTIAVVDDYAFWQVLPSLSGSMTTEPSVLKRARLGEDNAEVVFSSLGRMSTPPYALSEQIVITPRANTSGVYHQLTLLDAADSSVRDRMMLPQAMKPLEAGYGKTGFNFSFDGIYNYGDGISNLGTYTPMQTHDPENYQNIPWFHHAKNPSASPAWCGDYFMVKSTTSVLGFDFKAESYFSLETDTGSDDYGDYLASTGMNDTVVTYANIDAKTLEGEQRHFTLVRVWAPL